MGAPGDPAEGDGTPTVAPTLAMKLELFDMGDGGW